MTGGDQGQRAEEGVVADPHRAEAQQRQDGEGGRQRPADPSAACSENATARCQPASPSKIGRSATGTASAQAAREAAKIWSAARRTRAP